MWLPPKINGLRHQHVLNLKDHRVRTPGKPGILKPWYISIHWHYKKMNLNPAFRLKADVFLQGKWYLIVNEVLSKHSVSATPFQLVDVKNCILNWNLG
jgi:hypothetical protein